jgi:glycosyltransferase involved in cell wall biosynthesis
MIYISEKKYSFNNFDWKLYSKIYPNLQNEGFISNFDLWWHYLNIGEKNGYIFTDIKNTNKLLDKYELFNWKLYLTTYPQIINDGVITKEQTWHHYISHEHSKEIDFFSIDKKRITNKIIYYFIDNTCSNSIRTGIQNVTIFLAKELLEISKNKLDIIFVKWNSKLNTINPCSVEEINSFFGNNYVKPIKYNNYLPIHLNSERELNDCIFFCSELTFSSYLDLPSRLNNYLQMYNIKSIFILYDIIPLKLPVYDFLKEYFKQYIDYNVLNSNKIITISEFTKNEFIDYMEDKQINIPNIKCILLPYQYRHKEQSILKKQDCDKITILLPGTVEPRKQQVLFMKLFNKFIKENPYINVELIIFGKVIPICQNDFDFQLKESNNKIKYLGIIDNNQLSDLYNISNFVCFISLYEGFGLPIAESLWYGVPVLTSNFGSMYEVAKHGGCYTVDTRNENEIYLALKHLIINPLFIEKLKKEINNIAFSSWKDYSEQMYAEILDELK